MGQLVLWPLAQQRTLTLPWTCGADPDLTVNENSPLFALTLRIGYSSVVISWDDIDDHVRGDSRGLLSRVHVARIPVQTLKLFT